jgi:cell division protein FtsQ
MGTYQGKALMAKAARRRGGRKRLVVQMLLVAGVVAALAHVPWPALARHVAVIGELRVEGTRYLDPVRVQAIAGLAVGQPLWTADLRRARQSLLLDSRIAAAEVTRQLPRGIRIAIRERVPALLVDHGTPWELDSTGVLLAPLEKGVVADVPVLVGPDLEGVPAGTQVASSEIARGLRWAETLADPMLQLAGQVSELDVSRDPVTTLTLLDGTRVVADTWPPSARTLSALRVVLADLKHKGTTADELDVRFENQVIVRPAAQNEAEGRQG